MTKAVKFLFMAILACASAMAQQITRSIRGAIVDPTGAIVQNATITARQSKRASSVPRLPTTAAIS
jgi:hypothetical protein